MAFTCLLDPLKEVFRRQKWTTVGDAVDRLNSYTVFGFVVSSAILGLNVYIFNSIVCWLPAEFDGAKSWVQYVENYCWIQNTYYTSMDTGLRQMTDSEKSSKEISYYQWSPFILLILAFLFYLPTIVWDRFHSLNGIQLDSVCQMGSDCLTGDVRVRDKQIETFTRFLSHTFRMLRRRRSRSDASFLERHVRHRFTTVFFICSRMFCVLGICGELYLLNTMLGTDDLFFGFTVFRNLLNGVDWEVSGIFPRVTFCDVEHKQPGNIHKYTTQCVLPTNMLAEKIFVAVWFWLIVVGICTVMSLLWWIRILSPGQSEAGVRSWLIPYPESGLPLAPSMLKKGIDEQLRKFSSQFLPLDSLFILRIIDLNFGSVIAGEVLLGLWKEYRGEVLVSLEVPSRTSGSASTPSAGGPSPDSGKGTDIPHSHLNNSPVNYQKVLEVYDDGFREDIPFSSTRNSGIKKIPSMTIFNLKSQKVVPTFSRPAQSEC